MDSRGFDYIHQAAVFSPSGLHSRPYLSYQCLSEFLSFGGRRNTEGPKDGKTDGGMDVLKGRLENLFSNSKVSMCYLSKKGIHRSLYLKLLGEEEKPVFSEPVPGPAGHQP